MNLNRWSRSVVAFRPWLAPVVLAGLIPLVTQTAHAGNYGYFTTYNSQVEPGELELMIMNDITSPSSYRRHEGQGDYLSHMLELEYGVTRQFATELMVEWFEDLDSGDRRFTGFRWENRYRLFERSVPLNPMLYAEYEDLDPRTRFKMEVSGWIVPPYKEKGGEPDRERILETRLVLSDDVGPVNLAFNWIIETDVTDGYTAFGYSMGAMWMIHQDGGGAAGDPGHGHASAADAQVSAAPSEAGVSAHGCGSSHEKMVATEGAGGAATPDAGCGCRRHMPGCRCAHCRGLGGKCTCGHAGGVGLGLEMYGGMGDTKSFALRPSRQEHYLGPIVMYHLTSHWMFHAQLAIGLSKASDNLARLNFGYEF